MSSINPRESYQIGLNLDPSQEYNPRKADFNWYRQNWGIDEKGFGGTPNKYYPWFDKDQSEPMYMAHILENNPILSGLINTKVSILQSLGLAIFDEFNLDKEGAPTLVPFSEWPQDISDFFERNELDQWSHELLLDFERLGNAFTLIKFSASGEKILIVNRIEAETARKKVGGKDIGLCGDWKKQVREDKITDYPELKRTNFYNEEGQIKRGTTADHIYHFRLPAVHRPYYGVPSWYGARHWAEVANMVPIFHKSALKNQFGARVQVLVAEEYINLMRARINPESGEKFDELQVLTQIAGMISTYLTNPTNVGRAIATKMMRDGSGKEFPALKIVPLEIPNDDDRYVSLDKMMNQAVTSSEGISPDMAGIILPASLGSGSQLRLGWNLEIAKAEPTRNMILRLLNFIHRYNNWKPGWVWRYQDIRMATADMAPTGMGTNTPIVPTQDNPSNAIQTP